MAKKRELQKAPELVNVPAAAESEYVIGADVPLYRITADVVVSIVDIVNLSMISADFPKYTVNAMEELQGMILIPNPQDPTGTSLTVHPEWRSDFMRNAQALMTTLSEIAMRNIAAQEVAEEIAEEAAEEAASTDPTERN